MRISIFPFRRRAFADGVKFVVPFSDYFFDVFLSSTRRRANAIRVRDSPRAGRVKRSPSSSPNGKKTGAREQVGLKLDLFYPKIQILQELTSYFTEKEKISFQKKRRFSLAFFLDARFDAPPERKSAVDRNVLPVDVRRRVRR